MSFFSFTDRHQSELDVFIKASESPNYRPYPDLTADMTGQVDLPATPTEIAAHARRQAARAARAAGTAPGDEASSASRPRRVALALRRLLLERGHGRTASEEGVGVGAA